MAELKDENQSRENAGSGMNNSSNTDNESAENDKTGGEGERKRGGYGENGNLIPTTQLTEEERRELCSKAGRASVEARRRKRDMREIARALLDAQMDEGQIEDVLGSAQSLLDGDKSVAAVLLTRQVQKAGEGCVQSIEFLRDTAGYKPVNEVSVDATVTDADRALMDKISQRLKGDS